MASGVTGFVIFVALMVALAAVGSRLLGVRLSLVRALVFGWAGLAAGFGIGYLVTRRQPGITPLVVVSAVVATMVLTVVAELLSRSSGRPRTGGPLRPWLALVWMVRSIRRYLQLAQILRDRLGSLAERVPAQEAPGDALPELVIHNDRARNELGWRPRPAETTIVETAESLRDLGLLAQHH